MRSLKLITFDVTNTLIKVNVSPSYQYAAMGKKCGLDVNESAIKDVYGTEWNHFKQQYPIYGANQGMTCTEWWHKFVFRVFNAAGYRGSKSQLQEVAQRLHDEFPKTPEFWQVLPGATTVLEQLKQNGTQLAVLSNFDDRLEDVLEMLALRDYFSVIVTSFSAKNEKPSKEIFQTALNSFQVQAEDAVHIGDNLEEDYRGALNAGMNAILYDPAKKYVPFEYEQKDKGIRIEKLSNILDTVQL